MISLTHADNLVRRLATELAAEEKRVEEAVAAKAIGDNSGHWKKAHDLRVRLQAAMAIRDAIEEIVG
ncbi:MAG: hypothetical protein K5872_22155 [Rhizobiaceae bacterium]|nr:hypothetical protein [Rhizobiaceae bacterium]MCV0408924.1 hypothetical protein [Rhizobiaceae bacterium]